VIVLTLAFLLFTEGRTIQLDTAQGKFNLIPGCVVTNPDADILMVAADQVHHWSMDGSLIRSIDLGDFQPHAVMLYNGYYYISGYNRLGPETRLYNDQGTLVEVKEDYHRFFRISKGKLYGTVNFSSRDSTQSYYPNLLFEVHENLVRGNGIYKIPIIFKRARLNFKLAWVLEHKSSVYVINQLEPVIFSPNESSVSNVNQPSDYPSWELELKGFRKFEKGFPLERAIPRSEFKKAKSAWLGSFSRVQWTGKTRNGFAVCYSAKFGDKPASFLQKFNWNFKTQGSLVSLGDDFVIGYQDGYFIAFSSNEQSGDSITPSIRLIQD
jgi:hypothetical protein